MCANACVLSYPCSRHALGARQRPRRVLAAPRRRRACDLDLGRRGRGRRKARPSHRRRLRYTTPFERKHAGAKPRLPRATPLRAPCDPSTVGCTRGHRYSTRTNPRVPAISPGRVPARPRAPTPMDENECPVDVVSFGKTGIVHCKRWCRTYISPFVAWVNNGRQWRCNISASIITASNNK